MYSAPRSRACAIPWLLPAAKPTFRRFSSTVTAGNRARTYSALLSAEPLSTITVRRFG